MLVINYKYLVIIWIQCLDMLLMLFLATWKQNGKSFVQFSGRNWAFYFTGLGRNCHPCFPQHFLWNEFFLQMVLPWPASPRAQKHSLHTYWSRLICSLHALALACCKAPNLFLFSEPKNGKPKTDPLVAFIRDTYSPSGRGAAPLPTSGFFL